MKEKDEIIEQEKNNSKLYNVVVVCICVVLFIIFIVFATLQNYVTKPIYVDPPVDNGIQVSNENSSLEFGDLVYRGEPVKIINPVYKGEPIEFEFLK